MPEVPALLQILIVFALVVAAAARKLNLGIAAAAGGLLLALWRGMSLGDISAVALAEAFSADTLLLLLVMALIMIFSVAMKHSGAMDRFSASIVAFSPSKRMAMAIAPLLIGTLPVPGGAILSAPLVESMDREGEHAAGTLSAANYWFRHTLELLWPLYPAFILTTSLSGIPVPRLIMLNLYAAPLLFTLGIVFILKHPKPGIQGDRPLSVASEARRAPKFSEFAKGVAPLAIVLGVYVVLALIWNRAAPSFSLSPEAENLIGRFMPILTGLVAGGLYIAYLDRGFSSYKECFRLKNFKLLTVLVGIRIFSALLGAASLPAAAAGDLQSMGIPPILATALIPLIAGLVTGVGFGYVGLAFPIVVGMIPRGGPFPFEAAIVLAGAFGYVGMMLSPLHVCMVVTAEHFHTGLPSTIRRLLLPLGIFLTVAVIYVAFLSMILR